MNWIEYALLGLGTGAAYVLLAQGVLLIYRGSGVVNFSHGGFAMLAAYLYNVEFRNGLHWGVLLSFLTTVALVAALAGLVHPLIMRPLRTAAPLTRVIATLGVLIVIQSSATLVWGTASQTVTPVLPQGTIHLADHLSLSTDRLVLVLIAVGVTAGLHLYSRYATAGIATRAAAENQRAASALGWSPEALATASWTAGGALAAAAGILITPYAGLDATALPLIVIAAMAAALLGGFRSFPVVLAGGIAIGILRSLLVGPLDSLYHQEGSTDAVPFLVILAVLIFRGRSLPLRGTVVDRLPSLGSGAVRARYVLLAVAGLALLIAEVFPVNLNVAVGITFMAAITMLSIVVLTGYTGQLSLAQYALAGIGALCAARLGEAKWHLPFPLALVAGTAGAALAGVLFALPALRTRGVNLAVITLGLGLAIQAVVFNSTGIAGGVAGVPVSPPSLFGIDIDPILNPAHYTIFALLCFTAVAIAVANLRRGRAGRRLIAVRTNERAAAALGVNVVGAKIYAFALSAGIAGLGGTLLAFQSTSVVVGSGYAPADSISAVGLTVAGGAGYVIGPVLGALLQTGSIGSFIADHIASLDAWFPLIGGVSLLLILLTHPDGQAHVLVGAARRAVTLLPGRSGRTEAPAADGRGPAAATDPDEPGPAGTPGRDETGAAAPEAARAGRVAPKRLEVTGLGVRFGGVVALDGVSLTVEPGQIVGLMGPNGAGKTTFIDAVSGFVRPAAGSIRLDGEDLGGLGAHRRSRLGLSRSFQSLELFDDVTVRENLMAAADSADGLAYVSNLFWRGRIPFSAPAAAAIDEFGLRAVLGKKPTELSYGRRRLVAIARAVAAHPSVVLLDEPGAGLDETESAELGNLVRRLADSWGIGVLLVEHDVRMLFETCDRIVVLDFGRVIADGTPDEIAADPEVRAAYLGEDPGLPEPAGAESAVAPASRGGG
jgi:ABC-type branched-subunit amino acid transport system ATPase component/ABC-type branched-subunit amino acid transport system permease subunit